jgi:hypothetical protein
MLSEGARPSRNTPARRKAPRLPQGVSTEAHNYKNVSKNSLDDSWRTNFLGVLRLHGPVRKRTGPFRSA